MGCNHHRNHCTKVGTCRRKTKIDDTFVANHHNFPTAKNSVREILRVRWRKFIAQEWARKRARNAFFQFLKNYKKSFWSTKWTKVILPLNRLIFFDCQRSMQPKSGNGWEIRNRTFKTLIWCCIHRKAASEEELELSTVAWETMWQIFHWRSWSGTFKFNVLFYWQNLCLLLIRNFQPE